MKIIFEWLEYLAKPRSSDTVIEINPMSKVPPSFGHNSSSRRQTESKLDPDCPRVVRFTIDIDEVISVNLEPEMVTPE